MSAVLEREASFPVCLHCGQLIARSESIGWFHLLSDSIWCDPMSPGITNFAVPADGERG